MSHQDTTITTTAVQSPPAPLTERHQAPHDRRVLHLQQGLEEAQHVHCHHSAPTHPLSNQSHSGLACYRLLMLPVCLPPRHAMPRPKQDPSLQSSEPTTPPISAHRLRPRIPETVVLMTMTMTALSSSLASSSCRLLVCVCLDRPSCSNDPEAGQHSNATLTPFPDQTKQKQCRGPNKEKESTPETRHQLNPAASFSACRPGPRNPS